MGEKFKRGGFQADKTYIQPISRQTPDPDGCKAFNPPKPGIKIATNRGPFKILEIIGSVIFHHGKPYFRARGEIVKRK